MPLKQVIVMRKDLNMRKGKMVAQGSHASMMVVLSSLQSTQLPEMERITYHLRTQQQIIQWAREGMTKICVGVDSPMELYKVAEDAKQAGLTVHEVVDAGHTEFKGIPTKTCLCIGPNEADAIDTITGHLNLL